MIAQRDLPYIDPLAPRDSLYRAYVRLTTTRPVRWLSRRVGWRLDPYLMRITGGWLSSGLMLPTALLETRGARTGQTRRNVVIYFHDGDRVTVVASNAGGPRHPAWYHNARMHPDVVLAGKPVRAVVVEDEPERARIWELADRVFPPYAGFRNSAARSGRAIPILQFVAR